MDEPFGAVDPIVRAQLQQEFLQLQRELHKTIVFVTHDIDEAILLGDRIAVLSRGRPHRAAGGAGRAAGPPGQRVRGRLPRSRPRPQAPVAACRRPRVCRSTRSTHVDGWRLVTDDDQRPVGWANGHAGGAGAGHAASARATRPAACSTPRCRHRPGAPCASTTTARSSASCGTRRSASSSANGCRRHMILAAPSWSGDQMSGNWDVLWYYTLDHLRITFIALALGVARGVPSRHRRLPVAPLVPADPVGHQRPLLHPVAGVARAARHRLRRGAERQAAHRHARASTPWPSSCGTSSRACGRCRPR